MVAPLRRKSVLIFALVFSLLAALGVIIAREWLRVGGGQDHMFEDFVLSLAIIGCILLVLAGYVWDRGLHIRLKALMEEARIRGEDRERGAARAGATPTR